MNEKNDLERLKEFKKNSGLSYHRLAIALGVHYQTVISWFVRGAKPSPMANERIQKFLRSVEKSAAAEESKR